VAQVKAVSRRAEFGFAHLPFEHCELMSERQILNHWLSNLPIILPSRFLRGLARFDRVLEDLQATSNSAQPLGFENGPVLRTGSVVREGDDIIESLMIAFVLMVGQILIERVAQGTLAKEDQLVQTFILD
jgi:hypothetical protein